MNVFSELDHKLRALQDSVDWAVDQLKAKDREIAALTARLHSVDNTWQFYDAMELDLHTAHVREAAKDAEIARLKDQYKIASNEDWFTKRIAWLESELDSVRTRLAEGENVITEFLRSECLGVDQCIIAPHKRLRAFLNPPEKPGEPHEDIHCRWCCHRSISNRIAFNGHLLCHDCFAAIVQRDLGRPVK